MSAVVESASRIRQLSASVVNKIAAGEVIERPASVVKELLENSLDALAGRIEVDVAAGGSELIRIVDDGEGIHPDDLPLAVASHATSKIADADDLFRVQTMGFRGEALASIAEVSRLRIRTRQPDQISGWELCVDCGEVSAPAPCGCPAGTQIEVRDLFVNTPVRRKFLRTASTEFGHISEQFTRVALANPRLHMVLRHNDRGVYELPSVADAGRRLETFYGSELAERLIPVEAEHGAARLWGYVAHPSQSKSTRKGQYLYLNGRWIQDRSLQHALSEAYRGLLMVGRQPIAFLFLEVPPDAVDVNVHPTKSEVRFRDAQPLYRLLLSTLRNRFLSLDLDSTLSLGRSQTVEPPDPARQGEVQRDLVAWAKQGLQDFRAFESTDDITFPEPRPAQSPPGHDGAAPETEAGWTEQAQPSAPNSDIEELQSHHPPAPSQPGLLRAMQVHDCYLVVETDDGLTVIDQHALHERILYEQLRTRVLAGSVEVQRLLVPVPVELSPREATLLLDQRELLAELGLTIEEFGGSTVSLVAYPTMLDRADPHKLVRSVAEHLEDSGSRTTRRDLLDGLLHMMSCKAAIKAGQRLTPEEIDSLLAQRELADDAHHCPHGRPTALTLSRNELDRQFGRLG